MSEPIVFIKIVLHPSLPLEGKGRVRVVARIRKILCLLILKRGLRSRLGDFEEKWFFILSGKISPLLEAVTDLRIFLFFCCHRSK